MRLLVVNAGSSSLKLSVLERTPGGGWRTTTRGEDLEALLDGLPEPPDAVGHRVVHGGERSAAVVLDDAVRAELAALTPLVPLHQPPALQGIDRCGAALPDVPQVACFDTAFHTTLPPAARTYALPARLRARVHVFGFHGLSHAWAARRTATLAPEAGRVLVAHLGAGSSLCGVLDGRSVETTMGLTPLDGLVMASRPGHLDPGVVEWLARETDEDLAEVLWRESGLVGLTGTGDLREVLRRETAGDPTAGLAVDVLCHRLRTAAGGVVAALGGLDALVFTGGIGEHSDVVRRRLCRDLAHLGVGEPARVPDDDDEDVVLSREGAAVVVLRVRAREDLQMADEVVRAVRT